MSKEELVLLNAFLGVIDHLWSCISPSANDKIWRQLLRVSNGIWWSPGPHKQNTPATKNNSSCKMFQFEHSEVMSTPCHSDKRATTSSEFILYRRVTCLSALWPTVFQWWWLWKVIVHQHKAQWECALCWLTYFLWVKSNIPLYLPFSIWLAVGNNMFVNVIREYFILTFLKETKGPSHKNWWITQAPKCPSHSEKTYQIKLE